MSFDLENSERKYSLQSSANAAASAGTGPTAKANAGQGQGPRRSWFSLDDIQYVFEEIFHQRSVVPPFETPSKPFLLRWDSTIPLALNNVAVFSREQARRHEDEVLRRGTSPWEVWGDEAGEMFKRRMAEVSLWTPSLPPLPCNIQLH